jgi:hypothetical protein
MSVFSRVAARYLRPLTLTLSALTLISLFALTAYTISGVGNAADEPPAQATQEAPETPAAAEPQAADALADPIDPYTFQFAVTIPAGDLTFSIPLSGGNGDQAYNWYVKCSDTDTPTQRSGTGTLDSPGIACSYSTSGIKTITLTPFNSNANAWLRAFGFCTNTTGANIQANKDKVTKVISSISPLMTRTVATTAVAYEWAYTFYYCRNLTMGAAFTFDKDAWSGVTGVGSRFALGMFNGCSGSTFTMNDVFNLPQDITTVGDYFADDMFYGCSGAAFNMNEVFNLPPGIIGNAGDFFVYRMFCLANSPALMMNDVFNLPKGITGAGIHFSESIFYGCKSNPNFTMNDDFNLPQGITGTVGDYFAYYMFNECSGAAFNMNEEFNLPPGITESGSDFARFMFRYCSGANFTMNSVFNLPENITTAGVRFAQQMFYGCSGAAFNMNEEFNLPTKIIQATSNFSEGIFFSCSGYAFTMNSVFNLPQGITTVGDYFAADMFYGCSGATFNMNDVFNLPPGISGTVGNYFAYRVFCNASAPNLRMNSIFNLPQGITVVGSVFAESIFYGCSGNAFTMNEVFNIPQGINSVGTQFLRYMFYTCNGASFQVNDVFKFPLLNNANLTKSLVLSQTFYLSTTAVYKTRTVNSILNGNFVTADTTQAAGKQTFYPYADNSVWEGLCSIQKYFGGFGQDGTNCFTVQYNKNGGEGDSLEDTACHPTYTACYLKGKPTWTKDAAFLDSTNWNALASGLGTDYAYGSNVASVSPINTPGITTILYAKWTEVTLSLTVQTLQEGSIDIGTLTPGGSSFGFGKAVANVKTNNPQGWSLTFSTNGSNMTCETTAASIPSITYQGVLTDNSWGYGVFASDPNASSVFSPVLAYPASNAINSSSNPTPTEGISSNIYFAAKAGMNTVACSYKSTITITALAQA